MQSKFITKKSKEVNSYYVFWCRKFITFFWSFLILKIFLRRLFDFSSCKLCFVSSHFSPSGTEKFLFSFSFNYFLNWSLCQLFSQQNNESKIIFVFFSSTWISCFRKLTQKDIEGTTLDTAKAHFVLKVLSLNDQFILLFMYFTWYSTQQKFSFQILVHPIQNLGDYD